MNIYLQRFKTLEERFWEKVDVRGENECWEWKGSRRNGYGRFFDGKSNVSAHRLSWEMKNGKTENNKIKVLHRCDNPPCVNPSHLFLGTQADNVVDMKNKGRLVSPKGENNGVHVLRESDVLEIRRMKKAGISQNGIAKIIGISKSCVKHVWSGRTWKWLK